MKTGHTPGPWEIFEGSIEVHYAVEQGCRIVGVRGRSDTAWVPETLEDQGEANARLIAAAPDLLVKGRTLNHAADYVWQLFARSEVNGKSWTEEVEVAMAALRDAIRGHSAAVAKAEGQQA